MEDIMIQNTTPKTIRRSSRAAKYRPLTIGYVEKESGFKSSVASKTMRISTYFKNEGFVPLGRALEKVEHNLTK
jgi:hypothetical protein